MVNQQQQFPPTVTLTVNPGAVNQGQQAFLSWYSNNATTCNATGGWSGGKGLTGNETVYPSFTTTYTITCVNSYGIATDAKTVIVNQQPTYYGGSTGNVQVTKSVRNVTLNHVNFMQMDEAHGLDMLEFEIRVRNNDYNTNYNYNYNQYNQNVMLRDILPQELLYVSGSTSLDGFTAPDGITQGGISLGTMNPGQEKVLRFRTTVFFGATPRTITNQAVATSGSGLSQSGFANVTIRPRGQVLGVADIPTGPEDMLPFTLTLGFLATIVMHMVFFRNEEPVLGFPSSASAPSVSFGTSALAAIGRGESSLQSIVRPRGYSYKQDLDALLTDIRAKEANPDTELSGA
jgi:hypothetical protein